MSVTIKSEKEIAFMREAGRILSIVHEELRDYLKPGLSTLDIDKKGEEIIRGYGCIPSFLNYNEYPASVCVSVNDEVVHGIPDKNRIIQDGDIVSLDTGVIYQGYHSDAARTWAIGAVSKKTEELIKVTEESFFAAMEFAREGCHLNDISKAVQQYVESFGFSVVRDLVGHGIGTKLHEDPEIPNYSKKRRGIKLMAGMTLAIEPMVNIGNYEVAWLDDDWTVVTIDGSLSAHYENTVLITKDAPEILSYGNKNGKRG